MTTALLEPALSTAGLLEALKRRYATKRFDPGREIPAETWEALEQALHGEVAGFEEALLQGAVHQYLDQRRATFERMAVRGVRTLDVLPERLSVALVNRYLDLKRSGAA